MKKIKLTIALLLALTMVFSLVACGGGKKDASAPAKAGEGAVIDPKAAGGGGIIKDEFVGKEATGLEDSKVAEGPIQLPKYTLTSKIVKQLGTGEEDRFDLFSDTYGAEVEFIVTSPNEQMNKLISLVMSDDAPDITMTYFRPSMIQKDLVQPVDALFDFDMPLWKGLRKSLDTYKWKGHYYMTNGVFARWDVLWYNRDIFAANGIDTPDVSFEKGEWTWSKFREDCKALTIDADANGKPEVWGVGIDDLNMFISSTGKGWVTIKEDGSIVNNVKSEEVARAMKFYLDLYNADKVVYMGEDCRDLFMTDQLAMIAGGLWYAGPFKEKMKTNSICFVPYPKDDAADKYYCTEGATGFFIPRGAKNPAGAAALISSKRFVYVDAAWLKIDSENSNKAYGLWDADDIKALWEWVQGPLLNPVPQLSTAFGIDDFNGDIFIRTRNGEPWTTIAEEISPKIDDNIARALEG